MTYFNTCDIAIIALCAALWGVLNSTLSPIFFQVFQLPFLCDIIGFASLIIALWWTRKFGTATAVGVIATIVNFIFRPDALFFLGFTAASFVFDVLVRILGYKNSFEKTFIGSASLVLFSVFSAAVAGTIIGLFFTAAPLLAKWGVLGWAGLHAVGGIIGGSIGAFITTALFMRGIRPATT